MTDAGNASPRQLALALGHRESFDREDFLPGPGNEAALALIERWPDWPSQSIALTGGGGQKPSRGDLGTCRRRTGYRKQRHRCRGGSARPLDRRAGD